MKIVTALLAYDKEPYFEAALLNALEHSDDVVVLESYEKCYQMLLPDIGYVEETVNKIADKRVHYVFAGAVDDKEEMMERLLYEVKQYLTPEDWLILQGSDEFWPLETISHLKQQKSDIVAVYYPFWNLIGDFDHYIAKTEKHFEWRVIEQNLDKCYDSTGHWSCRGKYEERALRIQDGWNYFENFTSIRDKELNHIHSSDPWQDRRVYIPLTSSLSWFHAGYVGNYHWLLRKILYHHIRNGTIVGFEKTELFRYLFYNETKDFKLTFDKLPNNIKLPYPLSKHKYYKLSKEKILKLA